MTGPATAKLLIPSMVAVLGVAGVSELKVSLAAITEIARQSSAKYVGANPHRHL